MLMMMLHTQVTVELKNDLAITGTLHSVDQYLNIKLTDIKVVNEQKYPHMVRVVGCAHPCVGVCVLPSIPPYTIPPLSCL